MNALVTQIKRLWSSAKTISSSFVKRLLGGASAAGKTVAGGLAIGATGFLVVFCMAAIGTATVFDYLSPNSKEVEQTSSPKVPPVPPTTGEGVPEA